MHPYDKPPPAFAKDPFIWDYVMKSMEASTGKNYPEWVGKHFAGSAAMYKNCVKKYGDAMASKSLTAPRTCANCSEDQLHYQDDYICSFCRDEFESGTEDITKAEPKDVPVTNLATPASEAAEALTKSLRTLLGANFATDEIVDQMAQETAKQYITKDVKSKLKACSRNYSAMGDKKLRKCADELDLCKGDAYDRVVASGEDLNAHRTKAIEAIEANLRSSLGI